MMPILDNVIQVVSQAGDSKASDLSIESGLGNDWDSLNHVNIVLALEDAFDISFDFEELDQITTVRKIISSLEEKGVGGDGLP